LLAARAVKIQRLPRRPADRSTPLDRDAVGRDLEMLISFLPTGIEKRSLQAALRIEGLGVIAFGAVTTRADQREIFHFAHSAF